MQRVDIIAVYFLPLQPPSITPRGRTLVTKPRNGGQTAQVAHAVSLNTNHANAFVAAAAETCWTRFDHREMRDVFTVISEGRDGRHIARTTSPTSEDDARQTHRENYADEPIVAVQQSSHPGQLIRRRRHHSVAPRVAEIKPEQAGGLGAQPAPISKLPLESCRLASGDGSSLI